MDEMMGEPSKTQRQRNPNLTRQASTKPLCPSMEMDVQIVVDGSASVTEQNFRTLNKLIADNLIGDWDISPTAVRVSHIYYSGHNYVRSKEDEQEQDKELVQLRVKGSDYPDDGGKRLTGKAMRSAYRRFRMFMRKSPDVLKVLIFFTNGQTDKEDPFETKEWSEMWNNRTIGLGGKVFAVGIGHHWESGGITQQELDTIAGSYGRTLRMNSYGQKDIKDMLHHIKDLLCLSLFDLKKCYEGDGTSYRGNKTTTETGKNCQDWTTIEQYIALVPVVLDSTFITKFGLTSNYCRNPNDIDVNGVKPDRPWCLARRTRLSIFIYKEYCDIPKCPTTVLIREQGTPGASSVLRSDSAYAASKAFTSNDDSWAPEYGQSPASIWMRFQRPHRLQAIGYRKTDHTEPKRLLVIGSNNCMDPWTILLDIENTGFTKFFEFRKWTIPRGNRTMFSCLGLRWPDIEPSPTVTPAVREILMWEEL